MKNLKLIAVGIALLSLSQSVALACSNSALDASVQSLGQRGCTMETSECCAACGTESKRTATESDGRGDIRDFKDWSGSDR